MTSESISAPLSIIALTELVEPIPAAKCSALFM